jgi:hypothetical protein
MVKMPGTEFMPVTTVRYGPLRPAAVPTTIPVAGLMPGVVSFDDGIWKLIWVGDT